MLKVLRDSHPSFAVQTQNNPSISIVDQRQIRPKDLYARYDGRWTLYRQTEENVPRFIGRYESIITAIFQANKRG